MKNKRKSNVDIVKSQISGVKTELKDGVFTFTGPLSISELAIKLKKTVAEIITFFFKQGKMYTINQILNEEEIAELCLDFDFDFQKKQEINASNFMEEIVIDDENDDDTNGDELITRPPVITIMGHVDHGKTTLIDNIRNANIAKSEAGGITQHTGSYQIRYNNKKITFLDTPGHESFTAMRARGAKVTDIVILVVAADDGVMPQTVEAINHAKVANVPIIVFVNKMDKQIKDVDRIKSELHTHGITPEEWGGENQFVYGSALTGQGINELLDVINLKAEIMDLKANPNREAIGTVIESKVDKGRGVVATLIIQTGTLYIRDFIVAGSRYGRIRTLSSTDAVARSLKKARPGTPVIITGLNYTPEAGSKFYGFSDEKFAKSLANERAGLDKQEVLKQRSIINVAHGAKLVNVIIKSDVQGTAEAIKHTLEKMSNDEIMVRIIHYSAGEISKSDLLLAESSNAIIYGFNILVNDFVKQYAKENSIVIKSFDVIYNIVDDLHRQVKSLKEPVFAKRKIGEALVKQVFFYSKVGHIAGCVVLEGKVLRQSFVNVYRNNKLIHEGRIDSLKHGVNDIKETTKGKEFGCHIHKFDDIKVDDSIHFFEEYLVEE